MAVDGFFEDASRKRKRGTASSSGRGRGGSSSSAGVNGSASNNTRKGKGRAVNDDEDTQSRPRRQPRQQEDEELDDESDENEAESELEGGDLDEDFESDTEADRKETPAQKRLRLAQQYLDSLKVAQGEQVGFDAAELERDLIAERLQKDVLEVSGKLHLRIADKLSYTPASAATTSNRVHRLPVTSAITSEDCKYLFTASKDGSIARWDISRITTPTLSSSIPTVSTEPEASTSTSTISKSSKPSPQQPQIIKLDFQPKRLPTKKRKNTASKGKAAIARNQPSQDLESQGHTDEIYALAISGDGLRLASAGKDRRICVWDISGSSPSTSAKTNGHAANTNVEKGGGCKWLSSLRGHKDTISSLQFRLGTNQLYTSSFDRTVKIYDIQSLSYIETLFGHQDKIYALNLLRNELAVTAGGRDKTLRYWKIKDETQLVFRAGGTSKIRSVLEGGLDDIENDEDEDDITANKKKAAMTTEKKFVEGSVDCTAMIDDTHFISGGDSGTISLWSVNKKKPIFSVPIAHGINEYASESEGIIGNPRWIISLSSLAYSDLFASGSWDGSIRLWRISDDIKSFKAVGIIPALGYVNSIQLQNIPLLGKKGQQKKMAALNAKARVLVTAALGQEHKFGRWMKLKEAKNQAMLAILEEGA